MGAPEIRLPFMQVSLIVDGHAPQDCLLFRHSCASCAYDLLAIDEKHIGKLNFFHNKVECLT
jgi:hypothetical protein